MERKINKRKIIQALAYFADRESTKTFNKMKAYKLLWLADRYHIRQYGRSITNDTYCAMPFGTVPSYTKNVLDTNLQEDFFDDYLEVIDNNSYKVKKDPNLKAFSKTDLDALNLILDKFGGMSPFDLSKFSHEFPEWLRFESKLNDPLEKNSYKIKDIDFFVNVDEVSGLFNDDDELLSLTKELYRN